MESPLRLHIYLERFQQVIRINHTKHQVDLNHDINGRLAYRKTKLGFNGAGSGSNKPNTNLSMVSCIEPWCCKRYVWQLASNWNLFSSLKQVSVVIELKQVDLKDPLPSKQPPTGSCKTPNGIRYPLTAPSLPLIGRCCPPKGQWRPPVRTYWNLTVPRCLAPGDSVPLTAARMSPNRFHMLIFPWELVPLVVLQVVAVDLSATHWNPTGNQLT